MQESNFEMPVPPKLDMAPPDKSFTLAIFLDVPYATQSESQKLDVYLPAKGKTPYPVVVNFHGGGWQLGDKRGGIARLAGLLLARGYAVVSANYRLSGEAMFPAQIYDAKAAIRWTRANAAKYSFDSQKVIAWGDSAGGHLAALLGTSGHIKELEDLSQGNPDQSSRVNAVFDLYGPVDFLLIDSQHEKLGQKTRHDTDSSPETRLLGGRISRVPEKCKMASPITYIRSDNPPFYIQHGKTDEAVPYFQSVNLANALKAIIGEQKVRLELVENAGHMDPIHISPERIEKILSFLYQVL